MFLPQFDLSEAFRNRLANIDEANEYLRSLVFPREKMKQLQSEAVATSVSLIVHAEESSVGYGRVARTIETMRGRSPSVDDIERQIYRIHSILEGIRFPERSKGLLHESTFKGWYRKLEQPSERIGHKKSETTVYRVSPKGIQKSSDKVFYSAAPHDKVKSLVSDLFDWLKYESKGVHPLLMGIIAYFQIVIIRPFIEHNAKMGWFLFLTVLKEHGFDFGGYLSLEKGIFVDKKHFQNNVLRLISTTYDSSNYHSSNFEPYIMYLLPLIENSVAEKRISLGREHPKSIGEMLEKADLNKRQHKALSYILENDRITNREYIELNGIQSRKLAWEELNQMVSAEILHTRGKGRSVFYALSNVVTKEAIHTHLGNN